MWWVRWEDIEGRIHYRAFGAAYLAWEFADMVGGYCFKDW